MKKTTLKNSYLKVAVVAFTALMTVSSAWAEVNETTVEEMDALADASMEEITGQTSWYDTHVIQKDFVMDRHPMTLGTASSEPTLTYSDLHKYNSDLSLSKNLTTPPAINKWTWMRTNEGVKPYQFMDDLTFVGVPLFVAGIIAKSEKKAFRQNDGTKHVLLTEFKTHIDDYTQYFGPAMTLGLKIGGVEGRSDWGRFFASTAMSYGIMAILVNGIKYTAKEMRPDGTTANSWPSGHTATSFVGATILHKEYGLTRSPWYSVAGYGVATATGVMRVLNNRHWVSDVLSGAGIGIMSGELAYALSDILFKGKGLLRNDLSNTANIIDHPSFFSVSMGIGLGPRDLTFDMGTAGFEDDFNVKFQAATAVGLEGAYFLNKYVGVGGRFRVKSSPIKGWDRIIDYAQQDVQDFLRSVDEDVDMQSLKGIVNTAEFSIGSDHLTEFAADLGLYFNLPLTNRFALGSKLLMGRSIMQELDLNAIYKGQVKDLSIVEAPDGNIDLQFVNAGKNYEESWDYFTLGGNNTTKFGTGISLTYAYKSNFSWKVFLDYDYTRKTYTMTYDPFYFLKQGAPVLYAATESDDPDLKDAFAPQQQSLKKNMHSFVIGGSFAINF